MSLIQKDNKLIVKNNALLVDLNNDPRARLGFQAFDGSNRYFKRLKYWDLDCCLLPPGTYSPNDGSFAIEKVVDDCCCPICKVVESERWYSCSVPVGTIIRCPLSISQAFSPLPNPCPPSPPPGPRDWFSWTRKPWHQITATTWRLGADENCCNPLGDKVYFELLDEIL